DAPGGAHGLADVDVRALRLHLDQGSVVPSRRPGQVALPRTDRDGVAEVREGGAGVAGHGGPPSSPSLSSEDRAVHIAQKSEQPVPRRGARYEAVRLRASRATTAGGPATTTCPPPSPPPGPRSMTQSALATTAMSCSTTTTVLPASTRR